MSKESKVSIVPARWLKIIIGKMEILDNVTEFKRSEKSRLCSPCGYSWETHEDFFVLVDSCGLVTKTSLKSRFLQRYCWI